MEFKIRFAEKDGRHAVIVSCAEGEITAFGVTDIAGKCWEMGWNRRAVMDAYCKAVAVKNGL